MLIFLTIAIVLLSAGAAAFAYRCYRDVFHPAVVFGPMLLFLYGYMPARMMLSGQLESYLTDDQAVFAQTVNCIGIAAFLLAMLVASRTRGGIPAPRPPLSMVRLWTGACALGAVGVAGYAYTLGEVGGFRAAYSESYGGGVADLGYVREAVLWTFPAALTLIATWGKVRVRLLDAALVICFAAPLAIHGVLGARRGPIFMVVAGLLAGWYLMRGRRPHALAVLIGGCAVGFAMLFLVSNRDTVYLGSSWDFESSPTAYLDVGEGNEFLYGGAAINHSAITREFAWGGRYLTTLFIRPIPRSLWPDKYEDASRVFGIADMNENLGIDVTALRATVGWTPGLGSALGLVADMWVEFSRLYVLALAALGYCIGRCWAAQRRGFGFATLLYGIVLSLSVYLVMQSVEAMLFRLMLMALPAWALWWVARPRLSGMHRVPLLHDPERYRRASATALPPNTNA